MKSEYQGVTGIHHSKSGRRSNCSCEECFAVTKKKMKEIMMQTNELPKRKRDKLLTVSKVIKMVGENKSVKEIAKELNFTKTYIYKLLKDKKVIHS